MKTLYSTLTFLFLFMLQVNAFGQTTEKQLIGHWKHVDVVDAIGVHVTLDIKPFDLTLSKDHHYEMTGEGARAIGSWSLQDDVLLLNRAVEPQQEVRVQKLYIHKATADSLVVEVKDFKVTGGFNIVMRKEK
jgi:hypothetical protein